MNSIIFLYRWLNHFIEKFVMTLIIIITGVTLYRVIMRFFFNFTPSWTEEFTCILVIWITLLGLAIGVREKLHLSITLFYDNIPRKAQKFLDTVISLGQLALGFFFVIEGISISVQQSSATMSVVKLHPFTDTLMPNSILYLGLPIAGVLILIYTFIQIFDKDNRFIITSMGTEDIH